MILHLRRALGPCGGFLRNAFTEPEFGSESRILEILHALLSPRLNLLCRRCLAVAGVLSPSFCSCHHESYRRFLENQAHGKEETYEEILESIIARDYKDSHRDLNPLRQASDAILLDTTNLTIDEVVMEIVRIIKERLN